MCSLYTLDQKKWQIPIGMLILKNCACEIVVFWTSTLSFWALLIIR